MCLLCNLPQTIYCERGASSSFLAEPINAFSNLAFPLAGFLAYKILKDQKIKSRALLIMPWFLSVVGLGSFIYHTARNSTTLIFDALPIFLFILYALFLTLEELFDSKIRALIILIGFILLEVVLSIFVPREFLNGSIRHFVAVIFISSLGILLIRKYGARVKIPIFSVIGLYALAIFFRSVDMSICNMVPIGTHFLWHTLAAFAGYNSIRLLATIKGSK